MAKNEKITLEYVDVADIKPYKKNPRHDENVDDVVESIKLFGIINPVVLDKNNELVAGHRRLRACQKLLYKQVPAIRAEHLTPEQIKAYRIVDNKTSEFGSWNSDLLSVELSEITNIDMSLFSLGDIDIDGQLKQEKKTINPYQHCHILISLPVEKIDEVAKIIKFCESKGYEYEQSNN